MNKLVMDTNVLISSLNSKRGASYQILDKIVNKEVTLCLSVPLYLEYKDVVSRNFDEKNKDFSNVLLPYLAEISQEVIIHYLWRPFLSDEKDDMVLELAVAVGANIITHNVKDFKEVENRFNIRIKTPKMFLEELK